MKRLLKRLFELWVILMVSLIAISVTAFLVVSTLKIIALW